MQPDHPQIIAHPPIIVGGMIAAGYLVGDLLELGLPPALEPVGWLLIVAGLLSGVLGIWEFKRAGTNAIPHKPALKLVTAGIYRLTRNPMYVGLLAIHAGLALLWNNAGLLLSWPFSAALLHYGVVLREEEYLTRKFGDDYLAFLSASRRWLW